MSEGSLRKGAKVALQGDVWTVVDVAPAEPLSEMVAALLEEEGFVTIVRAAASLGDALSHLGVAPTTTSVVLVPEASAEAALQLIAETVTDFEGDELDDVLAMLEADPNALGVSDDEGDDDSLA